MVVLVHGQCCVSLPPSIRDDDDGDGLFMGEYRVQKCRKCESRHEVTNITTEEILGAGRK